MTKVLKPSILSDLLALWAQSGGSPYNIPQVGRQIEFTVLTIVIESP